MAQDPKKVDTSKIVEKVERVKPWPKPPTKPSQKQ